MSGQGFLCCVQEALGAGKILELFDQQIGDFVSVCDDGTRLACAHAVYLPRVWPSTVLRCVRRGAVIATTAMSSWAR